MTHHNQDDKHNVLLYILLCQNNQNDIEKQFGCFFVQLMKALPIGQLIQYIQTIFLIKFLFKNDFKKLIFFK